ncbi:MAG: hypothetical protein KGJ45_11455 [Elusimicrobia bacterium]|nr:hypothetical protein [Elusimicrobiota bacterium]
MRTSKELTSTLFSKYELRPRYEAQRREFALALELTWKEGGWCNYLDETFYLDEELGLRPLIARGMTQGSGKGITMACGIQRPVGVTRFVLSQALHIICFHMEGRDVKELEYATNRAMADAVQRLGKHEFAWYCHGDPDIFVGKLDLAGQRLVRTR